MPGQGESEGIDWSDASCLGKLAIMTRADHVFAVVLAGGSGTRFWPASRRLRPKQLLALGPETETSLLASTVKRLEGLVKPEHVYVATGEHLLAATRDALPELGSDQFLAEPRAKNTAPCIAWATDVILARDPEAIVIVLPSDQHATDVEAFRATLERAIEEAAQGRITTVGIVPTRPETGYGYVRQGAARGQGAFETRAFVEKPDRETAERYVASGEYLWNAGMFIYRARDMRAAVETHLPELGRLLAALGETGDVARYFEAAPAISIDHGVMEKVPGQSVVPGSFGWSDLGSWESVWDLAEKDARGNVAPPSAVLADADRNLVVDLRTPGAARRPVIALVGTSDLCVVETDDGLLILPRERSQDVRKVVAELQARQRDDLL